MANIHFKDLEEADRALAQFEEIYSTDKMGGGLTSARALLAMGSGVGKHAALKLARQNNVLKASQTPPKKP